MVRASHRRSEGCGFDSRLGLRNIFLSLRLRLSIANSLPLCLYTKLFAKHGCIICESKFAQDAIVNVGESENGVHVVHCYLIEMKCFKYEFPVVGFFLLLFN